MQTSFMDVVYNNGGTQPQFICFIIAWQHFCKLFLLRHHVCKQTDLLWEAEWKELSYLYHN